jgi:group I intron endonuclease
VPIQKYSKLDEKCFKIKQFIPVRVYSTIPSNQLKCININYEKVYENIFDMKKDILNENKGKSGIYMLTNKLTNDTYIGQSIDLSNRFKNYLNLSYLKSKNNSIISRALIKYGYSNFSLTILEFCNKSDLLVREQYYFDKLNPQYNILKLAGSSLKLNHIKETKVKISKSLKGVYVKEKSALFGRQHTEKTKILMSNKKVKENNPFFGKTHSENSIELMRQKALGRKQSEDIKLKMSAISGKPVIIYEKFSSKGFNLIGSFVSARRAGKFLGISGSTVIKYMNSGEIYKDRYKFSSK